ncbi:phosphate acyltransferase PlsX [Candidatus Enterovibrio altilux]|uniref:Phosphate acyltransferase n=1 Tax=Candidatus Enterovibrio altilux TaxID=1927128 RepID=A0A291BBW0_9GAMM|nr:phosphate acyltransferase PlsX [Candidatus Enterovibrio luxaltus]ATF10490.1 Phosphate:acyl-ACP acyltransferase PlsX [Candidatus Enterovibrio luxaltus]
MTGLTIALDAMGGDFGPKVTVPATVQALSYFPSLKVVLVGNKPDITHQLVSLNYNNASRISIVHAESSIGNDISPSQALRSSRGTSMRIALELVADGSVDACISAGNTGALMALSRSLLKLLPGINRPALVSALPTLGCHQSWLLDLGANVSVNADTLFQFAVMGSVLAEAQLGYKPSVGLLNIGEEAIKGNDLVKRCSEMLQQCSVVNYIGYVEGDQLYTGKANVIVCDGFVGNVSLKTSEGVAKLLLGSMNVHIAANPFKKLAAKCLFGDLFNMLNHLNPDQHNGASLLGLHGIVVKSHGRADVSAFQHAIEEAVQEVERQLPKKICDRLEAALLERQY